MEEAKPFMMGATWLQTLVKMNIEDIKRHYTKRCGEFSLLAKILNKTFNRELDTYQHNAGGRQRRGLIDDIAGWFGAVDSSLNSIDGIQQDNENHGRFLKTGDAIQRLAMAEQMTDERQLTQ